MLSREGRDVMLSREGRDVMLSREGRDVMLSREGRIGDGFRKTLVVPAAFSPRESGEGTQWRSYQRRWIPAFAGMTI